MTISMKKYWWIALVILLMPIALNFILLIPPFTAIVGDEIVWLSFWGGYLGAIISTATAFVILYIQRKDNESENKKNRVNNEVQNQQNRVENERLNRENRQLQLNIMKYHQQSHWLDEFRKASLEYCHAFNYNDLIMISNIMWINPNDAFERIKVLFDRIATTNAKFSFVRKHNNKTNQLTDDIYKVHQEYRRVLDILQWFVLFYMTETNHQNRTPNHFLAFLQQATGQDDKIDYIIKLLQQPIASVNNWDYFRKIVMAIIVQTNSFEVDVRDKLYEYIKQEQEDINKLLTDNIES